MRVKIKSCGIVAEAGPSPGSEVEQTLTFLWQSESRLYIKEPARITEIAAVTAKRKPRLVRVATKVTEWVITRGWWACHVFVDSVAARDLCNRASSYNGGANWSRRGGSFKGDWYWRDVFPRAPRNSTESLAPAAIGRVSCIRDRRATKREAKTNGPAIPLSAINGPVAGRNRKFKPLNARGVVNRAAGRNFIARQSYG